MSRRSERLLAELELEWDEEEVLEEEDSLGPDRDYDTGTRATGEAIEHVAGALPNPVKVADLVKAAGAFVKGDIDKGIDSAVDVFVGDLLALVDMVDLVEKEAAGPTEEPNGPPEETNAPRGEPREKTAPRPSLRR